jgi:hypothetical protein
MPRRQRGKKNYFNFSLYLGSVVLSLAFLRLGDDVVIHNCLEASERSRLR